MKIEEAIEQFKYSIELIKQDGKDYLDERDIPMLEMGIEALENQLTKEEVVYLIKCMGGHTAKCGVEDISIKCMDKLCKIKEGQNE